MKVKATVWILPGSEKIIVDGYMIGPPSELCELSPDNVEDLKMYGFEKTSYEFQSWDDAAEFAESMCPVGWLIEYQSEDVQGFDINLIA